MAFYDYIRLIRFRHHFPFIPVILLALFFSEKITTGLIISLFVLYISFNVFLYGGLYTINDIVDIRPDSKHPVKKNRPLPTKRISIKSAAIFALLLIILGLVTGYFFNKKIFFMYFAFIGLNLIYTFLTKKIPYLDIFTNSLTHMLRAVMAILLVNVTIPYLVFLSYFLFSFGLLTAYRMTEKDIKGWQSRETLRHYTKGRFFIMELIPLIGLMGIAIIEYPHLFPVYSSMTGAYAFCILGVYFFKPARSAFRKFSVRT